MRSFYAKFRGEVEPIANVFALPKSGEAPPN